MTYFDLEKIDTYTYIYDIGLSGNYTLNIFILKLLNIVCIIFLGGLINLLYQTIIKYSKLMYNDSLDIYFVNFHIHLFLLYKLLYLLLCR